MHGHNKVTPRSWLAFELNVLRRMKFASVTLPFSPDPSLGAYLKRWEIRVAANDPMQSGWVRSVAEIQNNTERLSTDDVNVVLEDAYVPGYRLSNPSLAERFTETDAWWFDNVRQRIDTLQSPIHRAIASSLVLSVGQYVMSFSSETREFRQPLSSAFRRIWSSQPEVFNNGANNPCGNKRPDEFVVENPADLMFLRLPPPHGQSMRTDLGRSGWREEWLRGGSDFWDGLENSLSGRLGTATETKSQYLRLVDEMLRRATHIKNWAVAHVETGFITTQEIVEVISGIRRVDSIYTKDFSELTGAKAVIIIA